MIDRVILATTSTQQIDKLAFRILVGWLAVLGARILGQLLRGI